MLKRIFTFRKKHDGFTLVECLITMILLAIGILALSAAQVTYFKVNQQSQCAFQANTLADQVIEVILRDPVQVTGGGTVAYSISQGCSTSSNDFQGELCRALSHLSSQSMNNTTINLQLMDAANQIWRVTIDWINMGGTNSITKDIGLAS
jgi:type IV pilus modification protein PilV